MSYITRLELLQNTDYNMLEAMLGEAHCYYLKKILFNALEAKATKFLDNENNYGSEFAVRSLDNLMNNHMASKF